MSDGAAVAAAVCIQSSQRRRAAQIRYRQVLWAAAVIQTAYRARTERGGWRAPRQPYNPHGAGAMWNVVNSLEKRNLAVAIRHAHGGGLRDARSLWASLRLRVATTGQVRRVARAERAARHSLLTKCVRKINAHVQHAGLTLPELFSTLDVDGSGSLDYSEFRDGMEQIGLRFENVEIAALVQHMDSDGDGELDTAEFCEKMQELREAEASTGSAILSRLCRHLEHGGLSPESFFEQLDTDGDGELDLGEFEAALHSVGVVVGRAAVQRAMAELDLDRGGTLEIAELVRARRDSRRAPAPHIRPCTHARARARRCIHWAGICLRGAPFAWFRSRV
jgi:Ca2+-binding EF-hand superfamily protein